MKKILVISLYDGNNEIENVDEEEMREIESSSEKCKKGDKVGWLSEEFMYLELLWLNCLALLKCLSFILI